MPLGGYELKAITGSVIFVVIFTVTNIYTYIKMSNLAMDLEEENPLENLLLVTIYTNVFLTN